MGHYQITISYSLIWQPLYFYTTTSCTSFHLILFPPQILWSDSRGKTGNLLIEGFFWIPAFPKSIKPYNKSTV